MKEIKNVINIIKKQIPNLQQFTVCDAGCGLGLLSIALSPYVKNITAIDINKLFQSEKNIIVQQKDLLIDYKTGDFDIIIFSFFSNIKEILTKFNNLNDYKYIIYIRRLQKSDKVDKYLFYHSSIVYKKKIVNNIVVYIIRN